MKALKRADRIVIHTNDEKPVHVMTRDLANGEKAKDTAGVRGRSRFRQAADAAGDDRRQRARAGSRTTRSPASSTISDSATSSRPLARSSSARRRKAGSATNCRPTGSPKTCIRRPAIAPCGQPARLSSGSRRRSRCSSVVVGALAILLVQLLEILLRQIFGRRESVLGAAHRDDQLGKLELQTRACPGSGCAGSGTPSER